MLFAGLAAGGARGASNVDPAHPYAYSGNAGWINCRGDTTNGAVVGWYYCSGFLYGGNVGWVCLGDGSPTDGYAYGNTSASDYGVNHDGTGNLRGYAWGANIGWLNFEATGNPRVDLRTGKLSGCAWGANVGWISFSNAQAYVQIQNLDTGPDVDHDGLPDAWEKKVAGGTGLLSGGAHDQDGDGASDTEEFTADTDPTRQSDVLRVVSLSATGTTHRVGWTSRPTRLYRVESTNRLAVAGAWRDAGGGLLGPLAASPTTNAILGVTAPNLFYRVRAVVPLSP